MRAIDGVENNLYNPMQNYPNGEFISLFIAKAKADFKETQFGTLFCESELQYIECNYGTVPKGCVVSYQHPIIKENSKFLSINQRHTRPTLPAKILDPIYSMFFRVHSLMYLLHCKSQQNRLPSLSRKQGITGSQIALSWSPMRLKILHWRPEFHNWSAAGELKLFHN